MAKRTKTTEIVPQSAAKSLRTAEIELESIESTYKAVKAPLEAKIREGREKLLLAMQKTHIKSIKLDSGDVYMRVPKTTFEVTDDTLAFAWGRDNNCLRLDKVGANKILLKTVGVPDGFKQVDSEHIAIKRATNELA